jgi:hypothetical protein
MQIVDYSGIDCDDHGLNKQAKPQVQKNSSWRWDRFVNVHSQIGGSLVQPFPIEHSPVPSDGYFRRQNAVEYSVDDFIRQLVDNVILLVRVSSYVS